MRQILLVFLKDTFYSVDPRMGPAAANWHYNGPDAELLKLKLLNSGGLAVYMPDAENGTPQAHLNGETARLLAFFPPGGWSGYCWEPIAAATEVAVNDAVTRTRLAASGVLVPPH